MGCQASRNASTSGENRADELAKCAAVSADVRWSWLRGRSLFNFTELRSLFSIFKAAVGVKPTFQRQQQQQQLGTFGIAPIYSVETDSSNNRRSKRSPTATKKRKGEGGEDGEGVQEPIVMMMMGKAQFLSLCEGSSNDALLFRLGEVVGAFGSRLFDVLDEDGDGFLAFETFALGLSKLLKVWCEACGP